MEAWFRRRIGRTMWSRSLVLAAGLVICVAVPAQAATDTLDQSQTLTLSFQRLGLMAQTFTAGMTGQVDRVSLASDTSFGAVSLTIQIQTVNTTGPAIGAPSGTILGSTKFSGTLVCCKQFHDFSFSPGVPVAAGTKYAIVVHAVGLFTWYDSWSIDAYPAGQLYLSCNGCGWLTGSNYGRDFAFKTWVATNLNQAPAVAADHSTVAVNEGTAAANTGTFSDPDGDTVSLTASSGTVTKTGASSGTWSWSQPVSDEAAMQTVTVTADDDHGLSSTATFSVTVSPVAPTAVITPDPITSPEGTAIGLAGSATSPDPADNAAGFTYGWAVTKNGNAYSSGSGSSFTFTPDDEGTFVVTLTATDDGGMSGVASETIVGTNVPPTAKITGVSAGAPLVITSQELLTFAGAFTDPGKLDSHVVTWNFGDGQTAGANYGPGGSASFSATHAYIAAGTYNVRLTVTDDDGGVGQATTQVVIQTPEQALSAIARYVATIKSLNAGQQNSLISKLNAAADSAERGDTTAAHNQINAFLNEVTAYANTGLLSASDAATLRAAAHAVQAALGTYNRFLEWWPLET
jgi:PKD domain-containing protein/Big-like domain-containing protein/FIMAH domain-containing protein